MEYVSSNRIKLRDIFLDNGNWWKLFLKHKHLIRLSIIINVLNTDFHRCWNNHNTPLKFSNSPLRIFTKLLPFSHIFFVRHSATLFKP